MDPAAFDHLDSQTVCVAMRGAVVLGITPDEDSAKALCERHAPTYREWQPHERLDWVEGDGQPHLWMAYRSRDMGRFRGRPGTHRLYSVRQAPYYEVSRAQALAVLEAAGDTLDDAEVEQLIAIAERDAQLIAIAEREAKLIALALRDPRNRQGDADG